MKKRHLQVRLVRDGEEETITPAIPRELPIDEVHEIVFSIFVGIGALMIVSTIGKIAVSKLG